MALERLATATESGSRLDAALAWSAFAPVLPVAPRSKVPLIADWPNAASRHRDVVTKWWQKWPDANVGVLMDGLVCVDVDSADEMHDLEQKHGRLPRTLSETTGRGHHFFFTTNAPVANADLAPNVHLLARGKFAVVAGSTHHTGKRYALTSVVPPAPAPPWLNSRNNITTMLLSQKKRPELRCVTRNGTNEGHTSHTKSTFFANRRGVIHEHTRDVTLTSIAGYLRSRGADYAEILEHLRQVNITRCLPPLTDRQVRKIAKSLSSPRYAKGRRRQRTAVTGAEFCVSDTALLAFDAAVEQSSWRGLGGSHRLCLLAAIRRLVQRIQSWTFQLSVRDAAQAAGLSNGAAGRALVALQQDGWLEKVRTSRPGRDVDGRPVQLACEYRLRIPLRLVREAEQDKKRPDISATKMAECPSNRHTSRNGLSKGVFSHLRPASDVFLRLGQRNPKSASMPSGAVSAARITAAVELRRYRTVSALAKATGLHRGTVASWLPRLQRLHLVQFSPNRGWRRGKATLYDAAAAIRCVGENDRRHHLRLIQREDYVDWINKRKLPKAA